MDSFSSLRKTSWAGESSETTASPYTAASLIFNTWSIQQEVLFLCAHLKRSTNIFPNKIMPEVICTFLYIQAFTRSISNCPPCLGCYLWNNPCFTPTCRVPFIAMIRWWISIGLQAQSAILSLWTIKQLHCVLHTIAGKLKLVLILFLSIRNKKLWREKKEKASTLKKYLLHFKWNNRLKCDVTNTV